MTEGIKHVRFFLGANAPRGFVSRFDQLEREKDSWATYIIKGGPGSGKSTLMKRIAATFKDGQYIEEIYCSSDCASLDGVILHGQHCSIADGTAPHTLEPRYPGAYDRIVNLCDCWDEEKLFAQKDEIQRLTRRISSLHEASTRFLTAYDALTDDNRRIAQEHTDLSKIHAYAHRLAARELKPKENATPHEDVRFLSAICDKGVVVFEDTARVLAQRIYVIDDIWGAASPLLLGALREMCLVRGYDIISCYCPTNPDGKLEHLFIPELSLGFMTSNRVHPLYLEPYRVLHARRFTNVESLRLKKQRIAFGRKAATEMLGQAVAYLASAKELHDVLESFYIAACDFSKLDAAQEETIRRIQAH